MFLTFLSSPLVRETLAVLAVVAALFGFYEWAHSRGETDGYDKGLAVQQVTIDKLTARLNSEHKAVNDKVQAVEAQASNATVAATNTVAAANETRTQIVYKYLTAKTPSQPTANGATQPQSPVVTCGLDKATVETVNQLLQTQATYEDEQTFPEAQVQDASTTTPKPKEDQ